MNGQATTPPPPGGITFWQIIGGLIFIFVLLIMLPSWVVVIVAGIPLALGLAGLLNKWFGASENATRWIVTIAAIAFIGSVAWNFGQRQYPWFFENIKIHGVWQSFQATQAMDPQQPLGLHKATYDTRRDRITHTQRTWAGVLQNLRTGANPGSGQLEAVLRSAGLMNDISPAAKEKIAAGNLTAEDVIQEAEAQRIILQQQLEKIRLTPPSSTTPKLWLQSIQTGPLWAKLFWPGLILVGIGVLLWILPPARKWGGRLIFLGGFLALLGGAAAIADIKSADQVPGLRPAPRTVASVAAPRITKTFQIPAGQIVPTGIWMKTGEVARFSQPTPKLYYLKGNQYDVPVRSTEWADQWKSAGQIGLRGGPAATTVTITIASR